VSVEPSPAGAGPARPGDESQRLAVPERAPSVPPSDGDAAEATQKPSPAPEPAVTRPIRTRTGAMWVGLCLAAVLLVALIVFMLQNTTPVEVSFLGWTGTAPLAVALLIAGVAVGLVALVVGTVRITQLRHRLGAARKAASDPHA
jgi:lipopolysaccharide assembly protein A